MNLQLANEVCQTIYQVNDAPKTVTITATGLMPNVQIYCVQYMNNIPQRAGYLNAWQSNFSFSFDSNGYVLLLGMLLPQLANANGPVFDFGIGVGDGTGQDFDGYQGAEVNIAFSPNPFIGSIAPYNGTPQTVIYIGEFQPQRTLLPFLLNINNPVFNGQSQSNNNVGITFSVDADDHNIKMLEKMVWIHLFDGSGNLLGVVDTQDGTLTNNTCKINFMQNGFQFAAFIQGQSNGSNGFTFAIGDPETDAAVTISEA